MKIIKIYVDKLPESCGKCPLMVYDSDDAVCPVIADKDRRKIEGNPYDMCYRRSDCPLCEQTSANTYDRFTITPSDSTGKLAYRGGVTLY